MSIISVLSSGNYITVNKTIASELGLTEAILLGELASECEYWEKQDKLSDGFFFSTVENVKENTTLSDKQQRSALNTLKAKGIVTVILKGIPAKRYIKINEEKVLPYLLNNISQNGNTSSAKMEELSSAKREELDVPKGQSNKNNNNKNNNKNNTNKYNVEIEEIVAYLNKKAGTNYRAKSKDTQKHIIARLSEKFTVDDFKAVIDKKCADWIGTEWEQYLRPATLFGTKFENYLNAKSKKQNIPDQRPKSETDIAFASLFGD